MYLDKTGREIRSGDTLHNPHDAVGSYPVLADNAGNLFLGDYDSPMARYAPEIWWTITNR